MKARFFGDATKDKDGKPSSDIAGGFKKLIQAGLAEYRDSVGNRIDWKNKTVAYLASCSLGGEDGSEFLHGNIAN